MTNNELKDLVASLAVGNQELQESQMELTTQMKKTDHLMRKTDERIEKTYDMMRKTDERIEEADNRLTKKLDKLGLLVGNISNNQGSVAEEYFINSLRKDTNIGDIKFDIIDKNTKRHIGKIQDEFDIILINGSCVAIIEVKYKVHPGDIEKLNKKIINFRKLFPVYKEYKLYAGIASFSIPSKVFHMVEEKGYFLLQRKGNIVESFTKNLIAS